MFRKLRKLSPIARAVGVIGATAGLVTAVTFAQLTTNTVKLQANELDVTSDVLRISNGGAYGTTVSGFSNTNLIVGTEGPKKAFYLQNLANTRLAISVSIPGGPTTPNLNPNGIIFKFYDKDGATLLLTKTFAELEAAPQPLADQLDALATGNGGVPGTEGNYFYSVTVNPSAVLDNPASVPSFDLDFSGTSF